jgi:hypothetical protein
MAKVEKSEIIKTMIEALRLSPMAESIPTEIAKQIQPTFDVKEKPDVLTMVDEIAGSNSKSWTVPTGKRWKFRSGKVTAGTTATVGNRQFMVRVLSAQESDSYIWVARCADIAASSGTLQINFGNCGYADTDASEVAGYYYLPLPADLWLEEGWTFSFIDAANIDANDTMSVRFAVEEYSSTGGF